jgi:hypothetical protein
LQVRTGLVLAALGSILLFAVHVRLSFVSAQRAGLVLVGTGVAWLWLPVGGKRDALRRQLGRVLRYLDIDPGTTCDARAPLADLLDPQGTTGSAGERAASAEAANLDQPDG